VQLQSVAQKSAFVDKDIDKYVPKFDFKLPDQNIVATVIPVGINQRVNFMLDSIFESNSKIRYMKGYKIQVYSGNDKDEAEKVKKRLYQLSLNPDLSYKQPTYRIKLGDFTDRLDAKRFLVKLIIREYPKAIIIDDNVLIKK
jgi:hypothetical protein